MSSLIGRSFITTYNNGYSNVLKNKVGILPNPSVISPSENKWLAIWDTGATSTVITKKVVEELNLKPVSIGHARTPQGEYDAYTYYIDLFLPNGVRFPQLLVMEGQPAECDILIGMDVIGKGDFAVSNFDGKTSFTYRYPSCCRIDFVNHSYLTPQVIKATPNSPAKNSPCPCGSGKKYKQCCGKDLFK